MKRFIVTMLLIICVTVVKAGDLEEHIAKRDALIEERRQMNLSYEVLIREVTAVINYIEGLEAKKVDKKKKKKKKYKKAKKLQVDDGK